MEYNTVTLLYFSGTGSTAHAASCLERQFTERGIKIHKQNMAKISPSGVEASDLIIILSPVYAYRLAELTESFLKKLPDGKQRPVAVLSVSGGGEVSPNTACRVPAKRYLTRRGYDVVYENMLVMPSNFAAQAEPHLNLALLTVLPEKVETIINELLEGEKRLTVPKTKDRLITAFGVAEHLGGNIFGKNLYATSDCNQCGLCVKNCPKKNIKMVNGRPQFGWRCMWCLKCVYACNRTAILPGIMKSIILKDGYDIKKMSRLAAKEPKQEEYISKSGDPWEGVMKYLNK
ncbi:EFR1 family ferrodoxin [Lacrimispora sp.]|jgi:ferredoxin|uniref:EFR1 family ferrodoxin n=1 Tax=Lacrimispora sp. TaxID=2719234 RepID=UPI0028A812BD|nr:EFR1 family ferrodoxin [Lacrimispora sp.]